MSREEDKREVLREWNALPIEERQTEKQAIAFAMMMQQKYKFSGGSGDPYQTVKSWLIRALPLRSR